MISNLRHLLDRASLKAGWFQTASALTYAFSAVVLSWSLFLLGDTGQRLSARQESLANAIPGSAAADAIQRSIQDIQSTQVHVWWLVWLGVVLQLCGAIVAFCFPRSEASAIKEILELDESLKEILSKLFTSEQLSFSIANSVAALNAIIARRNSLKDKAQLAEDLHSMLAPLFCHHEPRSRVFYFSESAIYSASVYLYYEEERALKAVWREKHPALSAKGMGRDWLPGQGPVGRCYISGSVVFADDLVASGQAETTDIGVYASAMAIPIEVQGRPVGVLSVTSSDKGQFSEYRFGEAPDGSEFFVQCELLCRILSIYFEYTSADGGSNGTERAKEGSSDAPG